MSFYFQFIVLLVLLSVLFFVSRRSTNLFFAILLKITRQKKYAQWSLSLFYLPGTILHELSHFLIASVLFLKVYDISVFPETDGKTIKLGKVIYRKADFLRAIIVGVAPIFVGLGFLYWLISLSQIFNSLIYSLIFFYLVFVISTTLFSSKQDLVDLVYLIPVILLVVFVVYIFNIDLNFFIPLIRSLEGSLKFVYALNNYLLLSIAIHLVFLILTKIYLHFSK